jgi:PAS domain S-box-containing protein
MKVNLRRKDKIEYLENRVRYLEEVERFILDILEIASSLGDFQTSINKLRDTSVILDETRTKIQGLIPFESTAFFQVDEDSRDFVISSIFPENHRSYIQNEVDILIHEGTFAWALREKRPVMASTGDHKGYLVLHVMATSTRIRGMFVGLLKEENKSICDISLSLLSIILMNSANALESFELYRTIREINSNLERIDNYRLLFDTAPDGVEVLDSHGNILDCNEAQKKLLGYSNEQLIGNNSLDFFSDNSRNAFVKKSPSLKDTGYLEGEIELVSARGEIIPVWRKEKAIFDENGAFIGTVVYNRDISTRKRAEEEKRTLEARLQRAEKMEALGTLAGGVAHDLNNILSGLVSYPELLLMQIPGDSPLRKSIMTIQKSGEKAAAIVQDLLTLARRGIFQPQVVNLNDIIVDHFKTPEHEKLNLFHPNVEFTVNLEKNLMNIMGSPVHLSKTIMNLLSNAAEAIVEKGEICISTSNCYVDRPISGFDTVKEGEYITLTVSDTGTGISQDHMERIFEPFYSKKVMGKSGTGLGMAVVWGTIKDHEGYIDIHSVEGKGTTFALYFPVTREKLPKEEPRIAFDSYRGKGECIMVVDDVEEQREIVSEMLTRLGYRVVTVSSGEKAVNIIMNRPVDLVILDMIMDPGIDGLETYRRILGFHPGQKAIITSGFSETDRVREAQRLGARTYIKKPYLLEKIGLAIRNELDGKTIQLPDFASA